MQEDEIYISTDRYVYYDDLGEITQISNTNNTIGNYIVVHLDKVINFLTGKEAVSAYTVVYDTLLKQHGLKLKHSVTEATSKISNDIFEIPISTEQSADLIIFQDIKNKKWSIKIDEGLKQYLATHTSSYSKEIYFSITRKNDPHEFYRLILLDFATLVNNESVDIDFICQNEQSPDNLSVYTTKRFETYIHEVINDQQI